METVHMLKKIVLGLAATTALGFSLASYSASAAVVGGEPSASTIHGSADFADQPILLADKGRGGGDDHGGDDHGGGSGSGHGGSGGGQGGGNDDSGNDGGGDDGTPDQGSGCCEAGDDLLEDLFGSDDDGTPDQGHGDN